MSDVTGEHIFFKTTDQHVKTQRRPIIGISNVWQTCGVNGNKKIKKINFTKLLKHYCFNMHVLDVGFTFQHSANTKHIYCVQAYILAVWMQ